MKKAWLCSQASIALFECLSESTMALLADLTVISVFLKQTCLFQIYICVYIYDILGGEWGVHGTVSLLFLKKTPGSGFASYGGL